MPINSNLLSLNHITPSTSILIGDLRTVFEHSYFNILLNNIYGARQSSHFFDVDYSSTQFRPVNLNFLLSQSAAISTVQDSNYSAKRVVSSRYDGSKTTSARYLFYTGPTDTASFENNPPGPWEGDQSYGKTPALDWTTPYFAVFEEVGDAFPKKLGGSKIIISKLIDKTGNIIPLDNQNRNLYDVSTIFRPNTKAAIYYTSTDSGSLGLVNNLFTQSVDEAGFLYQTVAFYKPTPTLNVSSNPNPSTQVDNKIYFSVLNNQTLNNIYVDQELYGFNNLIAQNATNQKLYFYYGYPDSNTPGQTPLSSTGYLIGMALILRNFYPNTGEQYPSYDLYPWLRFNQVSYANSPDPGNPTDNYNFYINEQLLPLKVGDYIRVYDATKGNFTEPYSYDKDIFFISRASGSLIKDTIYDGRITDIQFTLPTNFNINNPSQFISSSLTSGAFSEVYFTGTKSASIYSTSDRFYSSSAAGTIILKTQDSGGNEINVGASSQNLGYGYDFKKLYKITNFSSSFLSTYNIPYTEYPYWAIGTSGSLFRSQGSASSNTFEQVPSSSISGSYPTSSFNALFIESESPLKDNPAFTPTQRERYQRPVMIAVGDSGSVYYSWDYGNTFTQSYFPRNDINLKDVTLCKYYETTVGGTTLLYDLVIAVGTSGSVYIGQSSGSSPASTTNTIEERARLGYPVLNFWSSSYSYSNFWDETTSSSYSWPASYKRENMVFNRIIPYVSNNVGTISGYTLTDDINYFLILANSGSIFSITPGSAGTLSFYANTNTAGVNLQYNDPPALFKFTNDNTPPTTYDPLNCYNTTTGIFTVPYSGNYRFSVNVPVTCSSVMGNPSNTFRAKIQVQLDVNGTLYNANTAGTATAILPVTQHNTGNYFVDVNVVGNFTLNNLNANDAITIKLSVTPDPTGGPQSSFTTITAKDLSGTGWFQLLSSPGSIKNISYKNAGIYSVSNLNRGNQLSPLTGSYVFNQLTPSRGYAFSSSANFVDAIYAGSQTVGGLPPYDKIFTNKGIFSSLPDFSTSNPSSTQGNPLNPDLPILYFIDSKGNNGTSSLAINSNLYSALFVTSSLQGFLTNNGNIYPATYTSGGNTYPFSSVDEWNELKILDSIYYLPPGNPTTLGTPVAKIPSLVIPTTSGSLWFYYPLLSGLTATTSSNNDWLFYSLARSNYPKALYSVVSAEDFSIYNPFSNLYVELTLDTPFPSLFYNIANLGATNFPYGIESTFPVSIASGSYFTGTRQSFRFYRRFNNEQYVLLKERVSNGTGFIIPEYYDPSLNYLELAKKAGIIT